VLRTEEVRLAYVAAAAAHLRKVYDDRMNVANVDRE
jgi:hypothetical protein